MLPAQELRVAHFKGQINDYSPANVAGGPYEMRGSWALDVQKGGVANFTADINMETSDYGITGATAVDPNNPATRGQHTHHIIVTNATVSYDTSVCPAFSPATTGSGIVITSGPATTSEMADPHPSNRRARPHCRSALPAERRSSFRTLRWCIPDLRPGISERKRSMAWSRRCQPSRCSVIQAPANRGALST